MLWIGDNFNKGFIINVFSTILLWIECTVLARFSIENFLIKVFIKLCMIFSTVIQQLFKQNADIF
jgi:glucose uptake protein GlcU